MWLRTSAKQLWHILVPVGAGFCAPMPAGPLAWAEAREIINQGEAKKITCVTGICLGP